MGPRLNSAQYEQSEDMHACNKQTQNVLFNIHTLFEKVNKYRNTK